MTSHASNRNGGMLIARNELSMPKWVAEQSNRIGPRPPPPPLTPENTESVVKQPSLPPKTKQPEPDYEVIEFSNQQYSNAPLRPNSASSGSKTPDNKLKCTLCGSGNPWVTCEACSQQIFCASCDDMFHKHPKRKSHQRKTIEKSRPPLPPKVLPGQPGPTAPVAPPRRNKRGFMTPIMQRKDQGNAMPGQFSESTSPTPSSKNATWQERLGSLPRGPNLLNRPLPETPKTPSESSRSTTPKSVFDNIQRPPSVALEKIKSKANATLDRMQLLQQRYRQQKEQMDRERSGSLTDQNMSAFDQWSSISQSPSHFRSGSMSSGINSSHIDLMDDTNFNLFHQRQMALQHHQTAIQRANQLGQRGMSSSVLHLNRKQPVPNNGWLNNSLQQAQSMAQLNCGNCAQHQLQWNGHHQHDPWSNPLSSQQHLNRSNMSLNVPAGYMMPQQMNNMYPPPTFMNQRNLMPQMYPQPYIRGMPVMNPGIICMPPSASRAASRAGSRMASPAMSRKSVTLRRKQRSNYIDDEATDDEDSDEDDRRSITSTRSGVSRSRQRLVSSSSQFQLDNDIESIQPKQHRNRLRNQRRDSIAKSVQNDWAPGRRTTSTNNNRSADSGFNSPRKTSRIYSDLDSEGSGTKALVQAKIEQKLKEESLKQKESKSKAHRKSPQTQKACAAVQTPAVKQTNKQEKIKKAVAELVKQVEKSSENKLENKNQATKNKDPSSLLEEQGTATDEGGDAKDDNEYEGEEEEEEEEDQNGSESEQIRDSDSKHDNRETDQIVEDDLGPPPSTPDHEWECEFCTFVNEANIKICSICCKTPSVKPKEIKKSASPLKQIKTSLNKKENQHTQNGDNKLAKQKSGTIKKNSLTSVQQTKTNNTESPTITNNLQTVESESTTDTLKRKESLEDIWAAFDENVQATAHEITRKAQSKKLTQVRSAGSSSSNTASVEPQENDPTQSQAREMGTSPPPQSISTQTYDTLPVHKTEPRDKAAAKPFPEPLLNDMIQHSHFPLSPKKQDLKSFEAEVLNKIHNISHVPLHHHNHHANHPIYSHSDHQRYRSNNDLHLDDTIPLDFESYYGLGKRQPSINELLLVQKTSSQMHSPYGGSTHDIPYSELSSIRPNYAENHKESDLYKYTPEELNAALKYCGSDVHPLAWLRDNWPKLIQTVQSLATKYGQERAENTIGTISQMEAREALRLHTGNIWQAVSECIEQRQRKYREISSKGNFSREDIVTALTTQQGNVDLALADLGRTQLKPFLMRIWGSPGGVENESGSQPLLAATQSSAFYNMNKDIHSFLSANASECMQTPNATGAHLTSKQMPSPFDLPAPINSSLENNNLMLDKIPSYSTDSPLQLDESIRGNKNVLKDLEVLIGNMEHNQQKQNEFVLRSIHEMSNLNPKTENEYDSESMRILTKSPIISSKLKTTSKDNDSKNEDDVKNFVWQHIQEIVPDLVQQVEMELVEDIGDEINHEYNGQAGEARETKSKIDQTASVPPPPPIDQDEFLMEEVIKPNIKNASIREELPPQYFYAAEIATFLLVFDKGLEREHHEQFQYETLEEASRQVYKMFKVPEVENVPQESSANQQQIKTEVNVDLNFEETKIDSLNTAVSTKDDIKTPQMPVLELQPTSNGLIPTFQTGVSSESAYDLLTNFIQVQPFKLRPQKEVIALETKSEILTEIPSENQSSTKISLRTPKISNGISNDHSLAEDYILQTTTAINAIEEIPHQQNQISDLNEKASAKENINLVVENNDTTVSNLTPFEPDKVIKEKLKSAATAESKSRAVNSNQYNQTVVENSSEELEQVTSKTETNEIIEQNLPDPSYFEESVNFFAMPASDVHQAFDSSESEPKSKAHTSQSESRDDNITENNITNGKSNTEVSSAQHSRNQTMSAIETRHLKNKRMSKIPVLRTATNKSLINSITISNKTHLNELNSAAVPKITHAEPEAGAGAEAEAEADETNTFASEITDQLQSLSTSGEMFLVIQEEVPENANTLALSASSSTLHSTISQSSSFKSPPTEFIPSGDPSKQNLTELVEDTQRLIKQMKDEISIDDFESSTDEGEYSDEFSDDYDDEEGEEEGDWEEEEDEEYDDIAEDITEENEVFSDEEDSISQTQSPLTSQESQDHREIHNNSALSNTTESFNHSLIDHIAQEGPIATKSGAIQNQNITADETASFPETENKFPELNVETVIDNNLENSQSSMQYVEMENTLPEMSAEILFTHATTQDDKILTTQNQFKTQNHSEENTVLASSSIDIILASTSTSEPVERSISQTQAESESVSTIQENNTAISQTGSTTTQTDLKPTKIAKEASPVSQQNQLDEPGNNEDKISEAYDDNVPSTSKSDQFSQTKKKTNEDVKTSVKKSLATSKIPKPREMKETKPKEVLKEAKQKEPKNDFKRKYSRSKSFSGPSTPIGIASVKTISQKFISPSPNSQLLAPKKYPTAAKKSSIADTINKFTKPSTSSENSTATSLFKSRTQPRIPKKKYHETCFSDDDYESSSEEEEIEPLEVRQRKLSVPVFKTYASIQEPEELNTDELVEKFTKENLSTNVAEAQVAAALVSMKFPQDVSLWAAKECSDLDHAIALLKQECELCSGTCALNQIVSMLKCTHKCCKQCAKTYFTVQITERSINDCSCPFCKLPELHNQTEHEDDNLEYFSNLDIFLKNILEPEVHELFQRKLRDRTLLKDPNFKWCVQCSSGFFARPKQKRLICPDCGSVTCAQCRKTWQKQHEGISCDQFSEWESANDPEVQAKGVQRHLEHNGIDCPKCKFKYSLARGGCMHFTCTQCKYEFCYGCAKPFMMGAKCTISPYCAKLGLHAHHPRNCLFYLRDKLPVQLQILLKNNNVSFKVDPIRVSDCDDDNEPTPSKKKEELCPIPIQKETPTGLVDTRCNGDVPEKHAGMCRNHYVEYLTAKVAKAKIDPLPIFDLTDCVQELRRRGIPLPERGPWDTDEIYKNMCAEVIQKNIPLNMD